MSQKRSALAKVLPVGYWDFTDWRGLSDALIKGSVGVTRVTRDPNGQVSVRLGLNEGLATCTQEDLRVQGCTKQSSDTFVVTVRGAIKLAVTSDTYTITLKYSKTDQKLSVSRLGGSQKTGGRNDLPTAALKMTHNCVTLPACCVQKLNAIGRVGTTGHEFLIIDAVSDALGWLDVSSNALISKLPEALYFGVTKAAGTPGAVDMGKMVDAAKRRSMQTTIAPCYLNHTGDLRTFWEKFAEAWNLELTH